MFTVNLQPHRETFNKLSSAFSHHVVITEASRQIRIAPVDGFHGGCSDGGVHVTCAFPSLKKCCCRMKRTDVVAKMSAELVKTRHHDVICAAFAELGRSVRIPFSLCSSQQSCLFSGLALLQGVAYTNGPSVELYSAT